MSGAVARYRVPSSRHRVELVIDRSRFIATVAPAESVNEAQQFVRAMNTEFPDATHNCWAYVVGSPGSTSQIGMSDDGEPHGTAGRPMLTVLLHSGIGDIAAVVTRYFGGTKLGTGGLVKAYSGAVQEALQSLPVTERVTWELITISLGYADISAIQQLFASHEVQVLEEKYETDVQYRLRIPQERAIGFETAVRNATRGQAQVERQP